jgi:hypothetical protein
VRASVARQRQSSHGVAGVVGLLRNVRVLLLHTNHITRIDNIGSMVSLEVVNLSTNKIDMLPDARVFAGLPRLVVSECDRSLCSHSRLGNSCPCFAAVCCAVFEACASLLFEGTRAELQPP